MPGYMSDVSSWPQRFRRLANESRDWSSEGDERWRFQRTTVTQDIQLLPPADSMFAGQQLSVKLSLVPPYPREPPTIRFRTTIPVHPNITNLGEVTAQTWLPAWQPSMGVVDVLEQLITWLDSPDMDNVGNAPALRHYNWDRDEAQVRQQTAERQSTQMQWEDALSIISGQGGTILERRGVENPFTDAAEIVTQPPSPVASSVQDEEDSSRPLINTGTDATPWPDDVEGHVVVRRGSRAWLGVLADNVL
ncbi:hypothetical protein B0A55_08638 [Friedmanniomyces simplex]|uniref:UBC core domain-containing protein n=1 Tax=Friedmanniomyces simplex TaxID=329884 RepID=A0A4U0WXM7_9PEZI|nr:hypothetical protein B0A55_08638 [Friedmanniomyces simplex]